jgi:hypothetical protein
MTSNSINSPEVNIGSKAYFALLANLSNLSFDDVTNGSMTSLSLNQKIHCLLSRSLNESKMWFDHSVA